MTLFISSDIFLQYAGLMTQRNATQRNATQRNATQRNATQRNATQLNSTLLPYEGNSTLFCFTLLSGFTFTSSSRFEYLPFLLMGVATLACLSLARVPPLLQQLEIGIIMEVVRLVEASTTNPFNSFFASGVID